MKPQPEPRKKATTSWEPVASWYDELLQPENDTYQSQVILPNLMRLAAPQGKRVLDIACGQGFFSRACAEAGAREVYGLDISPELIGFARQHAAEGKASSSAQRVMRFDVAPARNMPTVSSGAFDVALIVLALQNIKEMAETISEAARALVSGGTLIVVLNHPCFRIPKASAWGFDESTKTQYRRVDRYGKPFGVAMDMTPGAQDPQEKIHTMSFHRPLQEYVKTFAKAGFVVASLEEWISHKQSQPGPRAQAENEARTEFPLFLTFVLRKN